MRAKMVTLFCLLSITASLPFWGEPAAATRGVADVNQVPQSIKHKARLLTDALEKRGLEVSPGYFRMYTEDDCELSYSEMKTCYGNNPAAPYITFSVLPWPKEYVDPATDQAFGENLEGFNTSYRFDPREAIVILGLLPPPAAYFGLQTYLFTRQDVFDAKSEPYLFFSNNFPNLLGTFFSKVPQNRKRVISFSSLSNAINHVVIEDQSESAFDQERFFIITPDSFMDGAVREAFSEIPIDAKDIFTEPIPSTMRTGLNKPSDEFMTALRYVRPVNDGLADQWKADLPLIVLRVRDTSPGRRAEVYPPPDLAPRTFVDEYPLEADLRHLVKAVSERWGQPCTDDDCTNRAGEFILKIQEYPIHMLGPSCTKIGMNCQADSEDAAYQYSKSYVLDDDVIYALAGTLGTQTGSASYVGLGLTADMRVLGFDNLFDQDLKFTASSYAGQVSNADKFFLYYFARDCDGSRVKELTNGNCREISETALPPCNDPTSKTCDNLKFSIRDYIVPDTQRGPEPLTKLPSVVITLSKRNLRRR